MPKLPYCRPDTARAQRVDGDGGIKAAIWGGALAARHASCCKHANLHPSIFIPFSAAALLLYFKLLEVKRFVHNDFKFLGFFE
jgi:hypothetical protein